MTRWVGRTQGGVSESVGVLVDKAYIARRGRIRTEATSTLLPTRGVYKDFARFSSLHLALTVFD